MPFNTYSTLVSAIGNWLARSDLSDYIDDFIDLGEERLSRDVRIHEMETSFSTAISSGVVALPTGFLELKYAYVDRSPTQPLEPKDSQWIVRKYPTRSSQDIPQFIGIDGSNFVFGPYPDSNYTIAGMYYKKPTALSGTNTTNEFTDNAADLLLYACLLAATPFIKDDARIPLWKSEYQSILKDVQGQEKRKARRGARVSYN